MATQAIISIAKNGHTFIKIICGCDGYNAEKLANIIKDNRLDKIQDIYNVALENNFGCRECLAVMNNDDIIYKGDGEPSPLYRKTFDDPSFNPRWEFGTADNVIILKIDELTEKVIKMVKIKDCILATNGMVSTFDENGEQILGLQGFILDIADKLKENCDENTKWIFGGPGKGTLDCNMSWYWKKKKDEKE